MTEEQQKTVSELHLKQARIEELLEQKHGLEKKVYELGNEYERLRDQEKALVINLQKQGIYNYPASTEQTQFVPQRTPPLVTLTAS